MGGRLRRRLVFWGGAASVGVVGVGFALAADYAQSLFARIVAVSPLLPLVLTPAGLALAVLVTTRFFPGAQGSGIPQAIAARRMADAERRRLMSLRLAAGKVLLTLLALCVGASIGREGPTVQVGASIMLAIGVASGVGREPSLILAGGAAGIAAAFNTPLAGVVFAIEELSQAFTQRTSGLVVTAVILAGLASLALVGLHLFRPDDGDARPPSGLARRAAHRDRGRAGGWPLQHRHHRREPAPARRLRRLDRPLAGGACGCVRARHRRARPGLRRCHLRHRLCRAKAMLEGGADLGWFYPVAKLTATILSSICGIPGGLFAPSLSVGAGIGSVLAGLMPSTPVGAIIVLAMVAYFAGVVQAPITAFVIVSEMTADRGLLIPLMATATIAFGASRLVCAEPVYHALAHAFVTRPEGTRRAAGAGASKPADAAES